MAEKKKKDPHAGCPRPIWDGLQWVCMNHPTPEVVPKNRVDYAKEIEGGEHKPPAKVPGVLVPADQAEKMDQFGASLIGVLKDVAEFGVTMRAQEAAIGELQERVVKLERAKKK